jgi:hypothetical protein
MIMVRQGAQMIKDAAGRQPRSFFLDINRISILRLNDGNSYGARLITEKKWKTLPDSTNRCQMAWLKRSERQR